MNPYQYQASDGTTYQPTYFPPNSQGSTISTNLSVHHPQPLENLQRSFQMSQRGADFHQFSMQNHYQMQQFQLTPQFHPEAVAMAHLPYQVYHPCQAPFPSRHIIIPPHPEKLTTEEIMHYWVVGYNLYPIEDNPQEQYQYAPSTVYGSHGGSPNSHYFANSSLNYRYAKPQVYKGVTPVKPYAEANSMHYATYPTDNKSANEIFHSEPSSHSYANFTEHRAFPVPNDSDDDFDVYPKNLPEPVEKDKVHEQALDLLNSYKIPRGTERRNVINDKLADIFEAAINPFEHAVSLMEHIHYNLYESEEYPDYGFNGVTGMLIVRFSQWTRAKGDSLEYLLSKKIQKRAFSIAFRKKRMCFLPYISKAFGLTKAAGQFTLQICKLLHNKEVAFATQCIVALDAQISFDSRCLIEALILCGDFGLIETFARGAKHLQEKAVAILDAWVESHDYYTNCFREAQHFGYIPVGKKPVNPKNFQNQLTKFLKRFNLGESAAPRTSRFRRLRHMKYLLYNFGRAKGQAKKVLSDGFINVDDIRFEELLSAISQKDLSLREEFICYCSERNKFNVLCVLAPTWDLLNHRVFKNEILKQDVEREYAEHLIRIESDWNREEWRFDNPANDANLAQYARMDCYPLYLNKSDIKIVDTVKHLEEFIFEMEGNLKFIGSMTSEDLIIGVDCEWFDDHSYAHEVLSLLQLGFRSHCVLIDMFKLADREGRDKNLGKAATSDHWTKFSRAVFLSPYTKVMYGGAHDFTVLGRITGMIVPRDFRKDNVIDLYEVFRVLRVFHPDVLNINGKEACGNGLKDVTKVVLEKSLDKTEQMSNWLRRPLRISQVLYASLDAFVLVSLIQTLRQRCLEAGLCFPPKPDPRKNSNRKRWNGLDMLRPSEFHVLIEGNLFGLARQLRSCGVDCKIVRDYENCRMTVRRAVMEDRVLIGARNLKAQFKDLLNTEHSYLRLPAEVLRKKAKDQCMYVLQYFHINVTEFDVFTRCVDCNCDSFISFSGEDLVSISAGSGSGCSFDGSNTLNEDFLDESDRERYENHMPLTTAEAVERDELNSDGRLDDSFPDITKVTGKYECSEERNTFTKRRWSNLCDYSLDIVTRDGVIKKNGVRIKAQEVPPRVLQNIKEFVVCSSCGKVFWDGLHYVRTVEKFCGPHAPTVHEKLCDDDENHVTDDEFQFDPENVAVRNSCTKNYDDDFEGPSFSWSDESLLTSDTSFGAGQNEYYSYNEATYSINSEEFPRYR